MHGSGAVSCSCSLLIRGPILPAVRQKLHLSPCADSRSRLSLAHDSRRWGVDSRTLRAANNVVGLRLWPRVIMQGLLPESWTSVNELPFSAGPAPSSVHHRY